jgi:hypothetical protein
MSAPPPVSSSAAAPAAAASSSSASVSDAPSNSTPLLYRDALTSVLSFLSLSELAAVLSVNKEWSAAVQSMRPSMLPVHISSDELTALLSSRLRRHVGAIIQQVDRPLSLQPGHLATLTHAFPQLQSLSATLLLRPGVKPLLLPPQLQCLKLVVEHPHLVFAGRVPALDALLAAVSELQQLHTLQLRMPRHADASSFALLQQLPLLRDLELDVAVPKMRHDLLPSCARSPCCIDCTSRRLGGAQSRKTARGAVQCAAW